MLLDGYIGTGGLCKFINGFFEIVNEETLYDFWKHRVHGMSFEEFRESQLSGTQKSQKDDTSVRDILKESFDILDDFSPKEAG